MNKALIFDIDGTLVPHHGTPHPTLLPVLRDAQQRGWKLMIATARRRPSAQLRLGELAPLLADGVYNNGTCTWLNHQLFAATKIDKIASQAAMQRIIQEPSLNCFSVACADDRIGFSRELTDNDKTTWGINSADICSLDVALAEYPIRLCGWSITEPLFDLLDDLNQHHSNAIHWHVVDRGLCLFGMPLGVDKQSSIAQWCADQDIAPENVVAFGDDLSDIALLQWAGTGYAVEDGHPDVLACTPHRTSSASVGGVANTVREIIDRQSIM